MKHWRFWLGLWAGKLAAIAVKVAGKRGTTFPGLIACRIAPDFIEKASHNYIQGIVIITGTNGKTTTANLLAHILKLSGQAVAFNQAGANMMTGIAGAILENTTWLGKSKAELALFEVDEATVPKLCAQATPRMAIVTNFFRDQLDRYGELDTTVRLVKEAMPDVTELVLNADDPLVAQFGIGVERAGDCIFYGVERTPGSHSESQETREARFCPQCGRELEYSLFHYSQLGHYACPECAFERPVPHVLAVEVGQDDGQIQFKVDSYSYKISLQGYYNLYNALAALTAAKRLGIKEKIIAQGLSEYTPQAGRMERFALTSGEATLTLIKNPTGFNQVLRALIEGQGQMRLLIGINDLAADGRDISWLWDVDFELLGQHQERIECVVCSGLRAEDMALRLKYAGVPVEKLVIERDLQVALGRVQEGRRPEERLYVLPTYTLLFPTRDLLESQAQEVGIKAKPWTERQRQGGR